MTTTFDGSSGPSGPSPTPRPAPAELPQAQPWNAPGTPADDSPDSLLDQLRERVDEATEAEPQEWVKEIPGGVGIRLVCNPDIANADFQRWTKQAMPRAKGRQRQRGGNPMDMDQLELAARALTATNRRIEIQRDDTWTPMRGRDGDELVLDSAELLRTFNVMDSTSVLRKLFRRDSRVIDAGTELLTEAGYLGDDGDDDDPA